MRALVFEKFGGPAVLHLRELPDPIPATGEILVRTASDRRDRAAELFARVRDGSLKVTIDARYPLADGAEAHAHLESRRALGKVLLIP